MENAITLAELLKIVMQFIVMILTTEIILFEFTITFMQVFIFSMLIYFAFKAFWRLTQ